MNVIVSNQKQDQLSSLDVDVIKNINGVYDVKEIIEMFKNFFYSRMILDVTALKDYTEYKTYEKLVHGLEADKIIFYLPEDSNLCTSNFLGHLISYGIYNFTTNTNGIKFLLNKANTFKDVEHILKMANLKDENDTGAEVATVDKNNTNNVVPNRKYIIGFRDVTGAAGSTSLIFMIKKELASVSGQSNVLAIEVDKNDFSLFNDKRMISVKANDVSKTIETYRDVNYFIIDLNNCEDDSFCDEVIYLLEPSTIKLNRLVRKNAGIFNKLSGKRVVLNKSLLLNNDVFDFESEAGIKVFYNLPPLDERKRNAIIGDFLTKLGIISSGSGSGKIFGLFRR